jgi:hypothetical protein
MAPLIGAFFFQEKLGGKIKKVGKNLPVLNISVST